MMTGEEADEHNGDGGAARLYGYIEYFSAVMRQRDSITNFLLWC